MTSILGLKVKFALTYLMALACGGISGVCGHLTILPMDWPLWRRCLWAVIAFYAVLVGKVLIGLAATSRRELQQHFFNEQQQRMAALQAQLDREARHGRGQG